MKFQLSAILAATLSVALIQPALAATVIIDDFESGPFALVDSGALGTPTLAEQSGLPTSSVIGGVRLVSADVLGSAADVAAATLVTTPGNDGVTFTSTSNFRNNYNLYYDGIADGQPQLIFPPGGLGADLSGTNGIQIDLATTGTKATVQLYLYESFNPANPPSAANISVKTQLVSGSMFFDFALFPNLDLTDVQTIRFYFENVTGEDIVTISRIAAVVPEPGTALLFGAGLVGIAARRRARR